MRIGLSLLVVFAITACDPYASIQQTGDIAAFEQYLKDYPTSPNAGTAKVLLEELYLKEARKAQTLEAYDAYLERWPEGAHRPKAMVERRTMLFDWAEDENTVESWQKFLDEYPRANRKLRKAAKRGKSAAEYRPFLEIGEVTIQKVNLAEDPKGPLDGWGFSADFKNNGKESIKFLQVKVSFLNSDGRVIGNDKWPLVASQFEIPMEEEKKVPVKPGETRTWEWTTGTVPKGWVPDTTAAPEKISLTTTAIMLLKKNTRTKGSK